MSKKSLKLLLTSSLLAVSAIAPIHVTAVTADEGSTTNLSEIKEKQAETQNALSNVSNKLAEAQARANELVESQKETTKEIGSLKERITQKSEEIEKRQAKLSEQAQTLQTKQLNKALVEFVFGGKDFQEVISRLRVVMDLMNANRQLVAEHKQDQEVLEETKVELDQKLALQEKNAYELEALKDSLSNEQVALAAQSQRLSQQEAEEVARQERAAKAAEEARLAAEEAARREAEAEEQAVEEVVVAEANSANEVVEAPVVETPAPAAPVVEVETPTPVETPTLAPTPTVEEAPAPAPAAPTVAPSTTGGVLGIAQQYIGTPYVWGGTTPNGFDCSGFVQYVYAQMGINLPRVTYNMEYAGTYISVSEAQPGDLLFWGGRGSSYHVAIYMGNGQYIDAPQPGDTVGIRPLSWYMPSFAVRL